jgi:DNA-binding winged helix-turn-helix (wHTH) protein
VYDRSIDVQILRLRRKIEANPSRPEYIRTEHGAGYMFDVPVATRANSLGPMRLDCASAR